jgi:hypothetical protein
MLILWNAIVKPREQGGCTTAECSDHEHDGSFQQFGRPRAEHRDYPEGADGSKDEARSEYEHEIEHASFKNPHESLLPLRVPPIALRCQWLRGVALDMSRIHLECPDSDPSDRLVAADVLLRQEPDEEEDEEEGEGDGDGKEDDDDDQDDDGYSE